MRTEEKKQQNLIKDTKENTLSDWLLLNQWCGEKEIIQEIYNIEMKTEERIKELRKETQQTVQTMLERFLRS